MKVYFDMVEERKMNNLNQVKKADLDRSLQLQK